MNNYFYKLHNFKIDDKLLYEEFMKVAIKHDMFERTRKFVEQTNGWSTHKTYYRLRINYPEKLTSDCDPVVIEGYNVSDQLGSYSIDDIVDDFKDTYTCKVVREVYDYLIDRYPNYKIGSIKYHVLAPHSSLTLHKDGTSKPRFFFSANVPDGCYMQIMDEKVPMNENGTLFRMMCNVLHNPLNESDGYRLSIVFDIE